MKKPVLFSVFVFCYFFSKAQNGVWTWVKGDSTKNSAGNYGMVGVSSPTNEPRARYTPAQWVDTAGNFWIFGGATGLNGVGGILSDLWKFDPNTETWTWMKGPGSTLNAQAVVLTMKGWYDYQNEPGSQSHGVPTWTTPDNHLWMLSNQGSYRGSLWQYDPITNNWAWMGKFQYRHYSALEAGDSSTSPGGRTEGNTTWVDNDGNLWLFGGTTFDIDGNGGQLNDLWKYEVQSGIWYWMNGSQSFLNTGGIGQVGIPSTTSYPSARDNNFFWKDDSGNFWLSGGMQLGVGTMYKDVWKYYPSANEWELIRPGLAHNEPYGEVCDTSFENESGYRYENRVTWKYSDYLILNYSGFIEEPEPGDLTKLYNNIWGYFPKENQWMEIAEGSNKGNRGEKGIPSPSNYPRARAGSVGFVDNQRQLWMFGGFCSEDTIIGSIPQSFYSNELWKYQLDTSCIPFRLTAPDTSLPDLTNGFIFPDAFTPNHDSNNDVFYPVLSVEVRLIAFSIYNRWGALLHSNPDSGWDGNLNYEPQPAGTYFYYATLQIKDQSATIVRQITSKGSLQLIRQ